MSHNDNQLRRKNRKERKHHRQGSHDRHLAAEFYRDICLPKDEPDVLITSEAIILPEEKDPALDAALDGRREELYRLTQEDPATVIGELEGLFERFPNASILMNWLSSAYERLGEHDKANAMTLLCYEKHPNYLFARTNYANILLQSGKTAQANEVMGGKWELRDLYPDRKVFHVSEFTAFATTAVFYFCGIGQLKRAEAFYEALRDIAPDSKATALAEIEILRSQFAKMIRQLESSGTHVSDPIVKATRSVGPKLLD
jgi:tetratricopeptide (TPR) repeat protein